MGIYYMAFAKKARQCFDFNKVRHPLPCGDWAPAAYWLGYLDGSPAEFNCGGRTRLRWFLARHPDDEILLDFDENEPSCYERKHEGGYVELPWPEDFAK